MTQLLANRYTLLHELGRGGMGVVYAVEDTVTGRTVALKTFHQEGAVTRHQQLRFKEEFLAMARLQHPNAVTVYDFGQLDAQAMYLTMEMVPGKELTALIGERGMPVEQACKLLIQLLQVLGFIHARGYVHRDLKAENIRVRDDGTLKLMDFGLMTLAGQAGSRQISGTPGYLAPESVQGAALEAPADLYAVGCLAMQMLTGRLPFEGTLIEVVRGHVATVPPTLRSRRPELPEALERIVKRLLAKSPADRYGSAASVVADLAALAGVEAARESAEQKRSYLRTSALVGREEELSALQAALATAKAGQGGAVLVGAPAGVGKSRLVQELALLAKLDGVLVLQGHSQAEAVAPYQSVAAALGVLTAASTDAERETHRAAIDGVCGACEGHAPGCDVKEAVWDWLVSVSARTPVLWLVEDLHWADAQSLALFNHVARQAGRAPVLAVATFRNDEVGPAHALWASVEEGASRYEKLGALTLAQQQALLSTMLGGPAINDDFARALYQATGGNAFFLTEVVRALMDDGLLAHRDDAWRFPSHPAVLGPLASVNATVARRVAHLSPGARALAAAAAVLGAHLDLDLLLAVSTLDEEVFFERLGELVERQFIHKQGESYAFPHSRIREALYEQLAPVERRALHQRAGLHLEAANPQPTGALVAELAHHFSHGEDAERAYRYSLWAGEVADRAGADAIALDHWIRASRFLEGIDLPEKLAAQKVLWRRIGINGMVLTNAAAVAAFERLLESERQGADRLALAELLALSAGAHAFAGEARASLAAAEEACGLVVGEGPIWQATTSPAKATALLLMGAFDEAVAVAKTAYEAIQGARLEGEGYGAHIGAVRALAIANAVSFQGYKPDPVTLERSYAASAAMGDHSPLIAPSYFGLHAAWAGREDEAMAYVEKTLAQCRAIGATPYPAATYVEAYVLWSRGEWDLALAQVDKAVVSSQLMMYIAQLVHVLRGQVLFDAGRLDEAEASWRETAAFAAEKDLHLAEMLARLGLGECASARSRHAEAAATLRAVKDTAASGRWHNPRVVLLAERALGRVAAAEKRWAEADAHFEAALALATDPAIDLPIEAAHTHRAWGDRHRDQGDRAAANRAWREAGTIYHRLGNMHGLATVTRSLEGLTGAPSPVAEAPSPVARWQVMRHISM